MNTSKKHEALRFVFYFLVLFVFFQGILFVFSKKVEPYISKVLHVKPICYMIRTITPSIPVFSSGASITSGTFSLSVDPPCNGLDAMVILASAILAFRAGWLKKISGIIVGCLFLYLFNITRIMVLFYSKAFSSDFFDFLHVYAGQTLAVIAGLAFFFLWASWSTSENVASWVNNEK